MTGRKRNGAGGVSHSVTSCLGQASVFSGCCKCTLHISDKTQKKRIDVKADASSATACQTKTRVRRTDAGGAHQVPFSRLFIPMHIIL